jgi:hypothetical protein
MAEDDVPLGNSKRFSYTLSTFSAWRLCGSLVAWKREIDEHVTQGMESESYRALVYATIATEARHLMAWFNAREDPEFFEAALADLSELLASVSPEAE